MKKRKILASAAAVAVSLGAVAALPSAASAEPTNPDASASEAPLHPLRVKLLERLPEFRLMIANERRIGASISTADVDKYSELLQNNEISSLNRSGQRDFHNFESSVLARIASVRSGQFRAETPELVRSHSEQRQAMRDRHETEYAPFEARVDAARDRWFDDNDSFDIWDYVAAREQIVEEAEPLTNRQKAERSDLYERLELESLDAMTPAQRQELEQFDLDKQNLLDLQRSELLDRSLPGRSLPGRSLPD